MSKRAAPQVSERRLKQYCGANEDNVQVSVGLTGARAGDVLRGVVSDNVSGSDTANVVLRIDSGTVHAPGIIRRSVEDTAGRERVVAAFAKHFGMSVSAAEMRYEDCPVDEACANHKPLGSGCHHSHEEGCSCAAAATFTILSQGVWQDFADAHSHGDTLRAMVADGRSCDWRDILQLMHTPGQPGGKTLVLRPRLFEIAVAPIALRPDDPRVATDECINAVPPWDGARSDVARAATAVYEIEDHLVRLPASASLPFGRDEVVDAVIEAMRGLDGLHLPSEAAGLVGRCVDVLCRLSAGGLKSSMQKLARFRAAQVQLTPELSVPTAMACAVSAALLLSASGVATHAHANPPPSHFLAIPRHDPSSVCKSPLLSLTPALTHSLGLTAVTRAASLPSCKCSRAGARRPSSALPSSSLKTRGP